MPPSIPELSLRVIVLAIILTLILATSNTYLALKLGILTSASIPAAIISMGVLRFFKDSSRLENNAVQTAASAGEAVAGGIVYTIPALIIIQYWHHFDYFTNFFIAASGGILGVLFSVPLRRILVHDRALPFPEGRAIAEVLKSSEEKMGMKHIVFGGLVGGFLELLQVGFRIIADNVSVFFAAKRTLFGFSLGFSATMVGAGYLVGFDMALSIIIGALILWGFGLPAVSYFYPPALAQTSVEQAVTYLWANELRYMGIGALLCAGIWTFLKLAKPLIKNIQSSLRSLDFTQNKGQLLPREERDLPLIVILGGVLGMGFLLFLFFNAIFPLSIISHSTSVNSLIILGSVLYVLIIGFLFSVITAYFSGMVGVTASPGSSVVIAGMLFAAWLFLTLATHLVGGALSEPQIKAAEAMAIIIGSVVTGIAAIANDNTQDLKVGQIIGATPWRQQLMLLLGVVVSALIIPPVMELLFNVYGIATIMPHAGMDSSQSLPAPVAAVMAAITEAVFRHTLPWSMMLIGAGIVVCIILINQRFKDSRKLSVLGIAIGMYLPLKTTFPLFLGGLIAYIVKRRSDKKANEQKGTLIACGLLAGSALMDVALAIPFSLLKSPTALSLTSAAWEPYGILLGFASILGLGYWIVKSVESK